MISRLCSVWDRRLRNVQSFKTHGFRYCLAHYIFCFATFSLFLKKGLKIRRRRSRELGGMGRSRRRKARKITLKTLVEDAVRSITGFRFFSGNMASFWDILKLLLKSVDDDDISKDEFLLLYDENMSKNPDFSYDSYGAFNLNEIDNSECLAVFRFHKNDGLAPPLVFQVTPRNHLWWGRSVLYNTETICLPMQIQRSNSTISRAQSQNNSVEQYTAEPSTSWKLCPCDTIKRKSITKLLWFHRQNTKAHLSTWLKSEGRL